VNNQVRTHEGRFFNSTVNNPGYASPAASDA